MSRVAAAMKKENSNSKEIQSNLLRMHHNVGLFRQNMTKVMPTEDERESNEEIK